MAINFAAANAIGLNNPGTEIITLVKDESGNFINPPSYDKMRAYLRSGEVPMLFVTDDAGETGSLYQLVEYSETENKIRFSNDVNTIEFSAGATAPVVSEVGGGGGASSSDVFIIHATSDETHTNAQLDKTTEQIYEAYQSGKYCLVYSEGKFLPVESVETHGAEALVRCGGLTFTGKQGMVGMISFHTNDGATWAPAVESPMLYNVCFFGLKIYGAGGRIYTISVDADGNLTSTAAT